VGEKPGQEKKWTAEKEKWQLCGPSLGTYTLVACTVDFGILVYMVYYFILRHMFILACIGEALIIVTK
jgi:hypothetical protein